MKEKRKNSQLNVAVQHPITEEDTHYYTWVFTILQHVDPKAFRLPIRKGQKANLERLNGTFGQRPRTDGVIELCCPECFSKDFKKTSTNHYRCSDCDANWMK